MEFSKKYLKSIEAAAGPKWSQVIFILGPFIRLIVYWFVISAA